MTIATGPESIAKDMILAGQLYSIDIVVMSWIGWLGFDHVSVSTFQVALPQGDGGTDPLPKMT